MRARNDGARILSALLFVAAAHPLTGQDTVSFSELELSAGLSGVALHGPLNRFWSPTPVAHLSLTAPYGRGALRFALEGGGSRALQKGLPDYVTLFPSLEWGPRGGAPGGTRWYAGAGLGLLWMRFSEGPNASELEMGLVATALLERPFGEAWVVGAGGRLRRVLTTESMDQLSFLVEIGRRWRPSGAVRKALAGSEAEGSPEGFVLEEPDSSVRAEPGGAPAAAGATSPEGDFTDVGAKELRQAGVLRLSEIFRALPAWDVATVDLRTSFTAPEALAAFGDGGFDVLVDGVPVPLDVLGVQSLDRLPLSLADVASLEARHTPSLHAGGFREGVLHFWTRVPERDGLEVGVRGLAENPTGDPGPFFHTDSLPNLDKLGTGYDVTARWRRGAASASGGLSFRSDLVTDPRVRSRTLSLRDPRVAYPVVRTLAPWGTFRLDLPSGEHVVRVGRSLRRDFFFLPALGFEVPARSELSHAGASGHVALGSSLRLDYRVFGARDALEESENHEGLDYDLRQVRRGAEAGLSLGQRWRVRLGGGVEDATVRSALLPGVVEETRTRAFGSGEAPLGRGRMRIEGEVRRRGEELGGAVAAHASQSFAAVRLSASVWHSRTPASDLEGPWALYSRGYAFLREAGVDVEESGVAGARLVSGGEVDVALSAGAGRWTVRPFFRAVRLGGVDVARASFVLEERRPVHRGPLLLSRGSGGEVAALGVEGAVSAGAWRLQGRYRWLSAVSGDPAFLDSRAALPEHRWLQSVAWTVREDLWLALRAEVRSDALWSAFEPMGAERIPGGVLLDLTGEKTFWDGRVRLRARLADLLDQHRALHPLGAAPGFTAGLEGEVRLHGGSDG